VSEASQKKPAVPPSDQAPQGPLDATPGEQPDGDLATVRQALATAEESARTQRDLYMRALAELDNVRKRAQRDIESANQYALERFVTELLPVRDGLEQAVRQGAQADAKTLVAGQDATLKLLDRAFEKFSIRTLDKPGEKFDPEIHEAVLMQPSASAEAGSVLQVVQTGYELKGRLLRPARVIVAKASDG
jgi:molecular chaperone GrpE